MFSSLAIPNYRKYFFGALVSNIGLWVGRTAQSWLVLTVLTDNSAVALGWVTALMFIPVVFLAPWTGAIADRFDKRKVMLSAQSVMIANSVLLGVLVITGAVELWMVYALVVADGIAGAIDNPARQAFVSELVAHDQMNNAISLNSASFNAARLLGPGAAGILIAWLGTGPAFIFNAASYVALFAALLTMNSAQLMPSPKSGGGPGRIVEGMRYVGRRPDIILLMFIAFTMGTFGMNFQMTNALMSVEVFKMGPTEYGFLGSLMAIGALAASLINARRTRTRLRHLIYALAGYTVVSIASGLAPTFWFFALTLIPAGLAAITVMVGCNTMVQMSVDAEVRGRVMALYMAILLGGTPFVSPLLGQIGELFGARWTVLFGAIACGLAAVGATVYIMRSKDLHLRVERDGLRPWIVLRQGEVTQGLEVNR